MAQKNKATLLTEARQLVDVEVDEKLTVPELEAFIAEHTPQRVSVASTAPAGSTPLVLGGGGLLAPLEEAHDVDPDHPTNRQLLADGLLLEIPVPETEED